MSGRKEYSRYQGYRGGGSGSVLLKVIVILLAVLLLAGLIFVVFFLGEYMEYTDEGPQFHPPWEDAESAPPEIPSDPVVVDDPVVVSSDPPRPLEPSGPGPAQLPAPEPIRALEVTSAQVGGGQAAQLAAAAQANALVVEMKNVNGMLAWRSASELAASMNVNAPDDSVSGAVRALAAEGNLYLVARIQCFRDPPLSLSADSLPTWSGEVWLDDQGLSWATPVSQKATDYITALCLELADMGFDEIVLDSSGFPESGDLSTLAQGAARPAEMSGTVTAFYARLSAAMASTGVRLSVQASEPMLRGEIQSSGLTAALLARYAQRVWLPAPQSGTDYAAILTDAGMNSASARIAVRTDTGWSTPQ